MKIDEMVISLFFDKKKFDDSAKQVENSVAKMSSGIKKSLESAFQLILGASGLNFGKDLIEGFGTMAAHLQDVSETIQENVSTLSIWENAVKRVGGTASQFESTVTSLAKAIQSARWGANPELLGILETKLKINPKTATGNFKEPIALLSEIGTALNKMDDRGAALSLANRMGIDDATFRLITKNKQELKELFDEVVKGGYVTEEQGKKAQALRAQWQEVGQQWTTIKNQIAEQILPVVKAFFDVLESGLDYLVKHKDVAVAAFTALTVASLALAMSNPFTAMLTVVGALITAVGYLRKLMKEMTLGKVDNKGKPWYDYLFTPETKKMLGFGGGNTTSTPKPTISKNTNTLKNAVKAAQALQESSNNPNAIGGYNEKELTYGLYQIRLSTARQPEALGGLGMSLGHQVTAADLMNPVINTRARDAYEKYANSIYQGATTPAAKSVEAAIGSDKFKAEALLALHNGGVKGLLHYQRTGRSYNRYSENIMANAEMMTSGYTASSAAAMRNNKTSSSDTHIQNLHVTLPNVTNAQQFHKELHAMKQNGWSFSGARLA